MEEGGIKEFMEKDMKKDMEKSVEKNVEKNIDREDLRKLIDTRSSRISRACGM